MGFEGLSGVEDVYDERQGNFLGVLDAVGEAVVGGIEGKFNNSDGGRGQSLAEVVGVERGGEEGDGEVGLGVEAKCELHEWAEMALC